MAALRQRAWYVNSIGIVSGQGKRYYIAVLTRDATEAYGIATVQGVSAIAWAHVAHS